MGVLLTRALLFWGLWALGSLGPGFLGTTMKAIKIGAELMEFPLRLLRKEGPAKVNGGSQGHCILLFSAEMQHVRDMPTSLYTYLKNVYTHVYIHSPYI